jgi:FMN-dependent oxidoreductase (nitrilotriacetate monooxygenase family)
VARTVRQWRPAWDGQFYIEMAQTLERACFDYIMIEDKLMVPETYGGSRDFALKNAMMVPKHDPAPLAVAMGMATQRLGVVATMSTMSYPPFMLARLSSTIDSLTRGRFGWNIVTSAEDLAAQNFGMDKLPLREHRYAMADEYMHVVRALFDSWEPDAIVLDRKKGVYADPSKVHTIDHKGEFYQVRGPLNTVPSPQGRPVFVQAGASPRGRDFAAQHADSIISVANGVEGMKAFREDIRARAVAQGRDPNEIKVLFCITPTLADTEEEARAKYIRTTTSDNFVTDILSSISAITEIDFSQFEVDKPLPHKLVTNGESGTLDKFQQWGSGKTLRELAADGGGGLVSSLELIGTLRPGRRQDGRGHGRGRRRRLPHHHPGAARQPPLSRRDRRRAGARLAAPRPGAHRIRTPEAARQSDGVLSGGEVVQPITSILRVCS